MEKLVGGIQVAALAVSAFLLAACGSAQDVAETGPDESTSSTMTQPSDPTSPPTTSEPTPDPSPATETTTAKPQVAGKPKVGNCYDTGNVAFNQQRDGSSPVACNSSHTAETVAVFAVGDSPDSGVIDKAWRSCQPRFKTYVGDAPTVSTLGLVIMLPSDAQVTAGHRWIRCDAIERSSYNRDVGLPRKGSVKGVLSGSVPDAYRGCVKHWPKVSLAVHFTSCRESHQAELIPEAISLGGPNAEFPGSKTLRTRSQQFCESTFQEYVPETLNYYYYYPTRASWKSGSHDTTCWALDTRGDGLPPI